MNVLDIEISLFKPSLFEGKYIPGTNPETISLGNAIGFNHTPEVLQAIKAEADKAKRSALKTQLWAITPSAVLEGGRRAENVVKHSGLLAFDIDSINKDELSAYKKCISEIPYTVYVGESASGLGLWGLFRISNPEKHGEHFDAMQRAFSDLEITIDTAPRAVNSLRYLAYDSGHYFNPNAKIFDKTLESLKTPKNSLKWKMYDKEFNGNKLLEWFNANCTAENMDEILTAYGFNYHSKRGDRYRYTRPGKDTKGGLSVDYHADKRTLFSFSENVPHIEKWKSESNGWSCSPVTALLIYGCEGSWKNVSLYINSIKG